MSSDGSGDDGCGFPAVGEAEDFFHVSSSQDMQKLVDEFFDGLESRDSVSVDGTSLELPSGSNTSLPLLPLAMPNASRCSEPAGGIQLPAKSTDQSGSSIAGTLIYTDMQRRRLKSKRGTWDKTSKKKASTPNPEVFMGNPCFKLFKNLPQDTRGKVKTRMRVKKSRATERLKKGFLVTLRGTTYSWPKDPMAEDKFMAEFLPAFYYDVAASPFSTAEDRGCAMDHLMFLQGTGALSEQGRVLEAKVLRNTSILMTYNGAWGLLTELSPPPTLSVEALTQQLKAYAPAKNIFAGFLQHFENLRANHKIKQFVVSMEICPTTWKTRSAVRVHLHSWILQGRDSSLVLEDLNYQDSKPHVNMEALEFLGGRGTRSVAASYSGAFYLQIDKIGVVRTQGTVEPFINYQVKDYWITTMLSAQKILFDTARALYLQNVTRAESNIRQLEFVQKSFLEKQAARDTEACEAEILKTEVEFKVIPEVEDWRKQYVSVKSRYLFLVLDGASQTGKTRFAYSLSPPPTDKVGSPASDGLSSQVNKRKLVYYADCSGGLPDLRGFSRSQHKIVILDELHPSNAVVLKKIMQASNDEAVMGSSPTMQSAYRVNSYRTMIVVTTNTWASGCAQLPVKDAEWLKVNSIYVHVPGPLWKQQV